MRKISKLLAIILSVAIICAALPLGAITASAETEGYYTYSVTDGEATITDCSTSISGKVTIPSTLGGYPVTSIGEAAFEFCTGLTSVTIPNSVTSIGGFAFFDCYNLTSVTIPNSVTSIGNEAFYGTAYYNEPANWTDGVLYINDCLIAANNDAPENYTVKNGTRLIGNYAFSGCAGFTSVTIPNSVTSIDHDAFSDCAGLESITVDKNNPTYHSEGNCIIETTSKKLICGCKNSIIPSDGSVTSIGRCAFRGCTGLTSITIPNSVTDIEWLAFEGCTGLTSITIPNSVTSIDVGAFEGCTGLESIVVDTNNPIYHSAGNCLIVTASNTLFLGCKNSIIPTDGSVDSIDDWAFGYCESLTSVTIPDSVTSIGYSAFYACTGLTSITIPGSVTSIGGAAFCNCTGLTSVTIPNSVISIGWDAFYGCDNLKTVYYFGTPEEFATLVTEYGNDWLLDLEIVYMQQLESNDVELTAERGVLEEGTVLSAEKIDSNLEQIAEQLPENYDAKSIVVYELSLTKDSEKVEFDGTVTVTVPLPEGMNPNKCRVLYMADDGSLTDMNAVYKDGAMVFDTTHFSTYILAESTALPGDLDGNKEITDADAVYLLMYTFFPDDYPINQDCDFDGNGAITDADAVYLLMYTFFPEDYPIVKAQAPVEPTDPGETEPHVF